MRLFKYRKELANLLGWCWLLVALFGLLTACQANLPAPTITTTFSSEPSSSKPPAGLESTGDNTPIRTDLPTPTRLPSPEPSLSLEPTVGYTPIPPSASPTSTQPPHIILLFTGVIVPARCVQAAIDAKGNADYLYAEVSHLIREADLAVGTLNATLTDVAPRTGCVPTYVLVGDPKNADAMARAGFDVMSVATNHIKNCGLGNCADRAFFDTLENLRRVGILPVGGGKNLAEALQPVVVNIQGVRFGIVSLGHIEPQVFATEDTPGIAVLNEENLRASIAAARQRSDVVIVMPHWGPEDVPVPGAWQQQYARLAVEAGANLVVGNHTHVVQAYQEINGVMVFYGLGNFVFDQDWARDHQQGVILLVHFEGSNYHGFELIPTHVDADGTVHLADATEAAEVLERIEAVNRILP